ncbi:MAG: C39 family peptidase [Acholeplasma sp.]
MKNKPVNLIVLVLLLVLAACTTPKDEIIDENKEVKSLVIDETTTLTAKDLWQYKDDAHMLNLSLDASNHMVLTDASMAATYQSVAIETKHFETLVLSWNVKQMKDARATFMVAVGDGTDFGKFQVMGMFKDEQNMSFNTSDDPFAKVNIDTLTNNDTLNNNYIKLKVTILPNTADGLKLENISVSLKKTENTLIYDASILENKRIDVSPLQQLSIPNIGNLICSPTSVAMVVNYYGKNFTQTDMAKKVFDHGRIIYGNWTFNASYAGSLDGLYARVEYIHDFKTVVDYIKNDIPVVFSIVTTSADQLDGAIMAFPAGHLIVLKGFENIDGVWYGIFNDPAEYDDNNVERKYPMSQVLNVWRQYTYVITDEFIF